MYKVHCSYSIYRFTVHRSSHHLEIFRGRVRITIGNIRIPSTGLEVAYNGQDAVEYHLKEVNVITLHCKLQYFQSGF